MTQAEPRDARSNARGVGFLCDFADGLDIELHVDVTKAGASDDLADTVDYSAVCDAVRSQSLHSTAIRPLAVERGG